MKARQFIEDLDLKGRRVLIRVDFNVPLDENPVSYTHLTLPTKVTV